MLPSRLVPFYLLHFSGMTEATGRQWIPRTESE